MMCKNGVILFCIYIHLFSAERQPSKPVSIYHSVVRSRISGVPSLQVLAAQKVHEMNRNGLLSGEQLVQLSSAIKNQSESPPEVVICNNVLQQDFPQMRKDAAEQYAADLSAGRVERSSSSGRVKQKALAIEIREKINRR